VLEVFDDKFVDQATCRIRCASDVAYALVRAAFTLM
jgi:hypothetical protein